MTSQWPQAGLSAVQGPAPRRPTGFETPGQAALAGWASVPSARPQVGGGRHSRDRAEVVIDIDPSYADRVHCVRRNGRWFEVVSGNAPTAGWDDPEFTAWS